MSIISFLLGNIILAVLLVIDPSARKTFFELNFNDKLPSILYSVGIGTCVVMAVEVLYLVVKYMITFINK